MFRRGALISFLLVSCFFDARPSIDDASPSPRVLRRYREVACSLPRDELRRLWNGYHPERSGEVQMVLRQPHAFAYAHAEPADHLQEIPMLLYGPGHVPAIGPVRRSVTMPDLAPTLARYVGFPFRSADGRPMKQAVLEPENEEPPRLILVVVWDGGGRNLLETWPNDWPTARGLVERGAWFDDATLGSAPSVTPPIHTTLGTGAYPRRHGLVDIFMRVDGKVTPSHGRGPQYLLVPTLADLYDRANENRPLIGVVASRDWHLGMIGQGSHFRGADRDLAVLMDERRGRWALPGANARYYSFPPYANQVSGLSEAIRDLDLEDGRLDEVWMGEDLTRPVSVRRTPAFARWQTRVIQEVVRREGFGADDVPDLLFTNYKQIDEVGHRWTMNSPQMQAVVRSADRELSELIGFLDRRVGRRRWILALTADHGIVPRHDLTGGFPVKKERFVADIHEAFGEGVVEQFRPTQLWVDMDRLAENGHTLDELARFIAAYTKGQNASDVGALPAAEREEPLFQAVFPTEALRGLPCLRR